MRVELLYWCNRFDVGDRVVLAKPARDRSADAEGLIGTVQEPVICKRHHDEPRPMGCYAGQRYVMFPAMLVDFDDRGPAYVDECECVPL